MNAETSRDPERKAHVWPMPKGMAARQALEHFEHTVKPRAYTFERFSYNPTSGVAVTV